MVWSLSKFSEHQNHWKSGLVNTDFLAQIPRVLISVGLGRGLTLYISTTSQVTQMLPVYGQHPEQHRPKICNHIMDIQLSRKFRFITSNQSPGTLISEWFAETTDINLSISTHLSFPLCGIKIAILNFLAQLDNQVHS